MDETKQPQVDPSQEGSREMVTVFAKQRAEQVASDTMLLAAKLRERDELGYNPLVSEGGLARVSGAQGRFSEVAGSIEIDAAAIEEAARSLRSALQEGIEEASAARQSAAISDDPENVRVIKFRFGQLSESVEALRGGLAKSLELDFTSATAELSALNAYLERVDDYLARLAQALEAY